jgi:hypothetical protein
MWMRVGHETFQEAMGTQVHEIAEHEDYELTQGTLDFIEAHIGRMRQPTLREPDDRGQLRLPRRQPL